MKNIVMQVPYMVLDILAIENVIGQKGLCLITVIEESIRCHNGGEASYNSIRNVHV